MSKKTTILNSLRDYASPSEQLRDEDISSIQSRIEELFLRYKIGCHAITYSIGPTVIRFEILPDDNYRLSIIKKLKDEMEISLSPRGARIIAPVPGKSTVAIEVPRQNPAIVGLKQILESAEFNDDSLCLPIACGIDTNNKPIVADLAKMPHLLIGGATGQGKTTFLNTLIMSLLYCKSPEELKFLLIDPKMVEFGVYEQIKDQYLVNIEGGNKGVIYDINDSAQALDALVAEMDRRYCLLQSAGYHTIADYNSKTETESLPYIVAIIDEYAGLKIELGKSIELPLIRLAQKSRAVGIHLIVATQRPSTNIITGVIKANFPCRIAFRTIQKIDSKVIIDCDGAEKHIGRGDMLLLNGSLNRVQAPFINNDEIDKICGTIASGNPVAPLRYTITPDEISDSGENSIAPKKSKHIEQFDSMFNAAAMYFIGKGKASTIDLEHTFGINYNRAGKIIDQLEAEGIIGHSKPGKPRAILVTVSEFLNRYRIK